MGEFEDRLFRDLMADHGAALLVAERPPPVRPLRARALAAVVIVVVLVGGLVVGSVVVGDGTPAYAVTQNPDGTVTVSVDDLRAIGPANARLRDLGVRAKVVPTTKDCPPDRGDPGPEPPGADLFPMPGPGNSITLPTGIPEGYTILLNFSPYPGRGNGLGFTGPRREPTPDCALDPADDPELRTGGG